jgi:CRP-like cAMP-binding protein
MRTLLPVPQCLATSTSIGCARVRSFRGVNEGTLHRAVQHCHVKRFEPDTVIIRQGDPAVAFHILIRGYVKLVQVTPDGHEIVTRLVGPGQEYGVLAALSGYAYPVSAQTLERCEALVWAGEVLAQLMEQYAQIGFNILRVMVDRNQLTQRRYQELLTEERGTANRAGASGTAVTGGKQVRQRYSDRHPVF